jgi:short subunit dehydrogenase-like uncharacterized protein
MAERDLDVVVFGATGVTGCRVAGYLAERCAGTDLTWAAAARDLGKLDRKMAEDGVECPVSIVADLDDPDSLAAMASRAKVVLDLVGPYTLYGRPVIEACVANGAHYMDLTGEMPFVRRVIEEFHDRAAEAGVKVVQVSGFEALPPDLAVAAAADKARERSGEALVSADCVVATKGMPAGLPRHTDVLSGGTMQSMVAVMDDEHAERALDPAALTLDPELAAEVRARSPIELGPRLGSNGEVIAPMSPAAYINPAVIHRSNNLAAEGRGERPQPFRYREGIAIPGPTVTLPARYAAAGAMSATQAGFRAIAGSRRPRLRAGASRAMSKVFPGSGFGPSGDRLEDWRWGLTVEAETTGGNAVTVELDADGHPGYLTTARMLAEAGLALAEPGATPERAGCLTPATALGTGSMPRFERAGMRFAVSG